MNQHGLNLIFECHLSFNVDHVYVEQAEDTESQYYQTVSTFETQVSFSIENGIRYKNQAPDASHSDQQTLFPGRVQWYHSFTQM